MITIKDLNLSFGSNKILSDLNWHIKNGKKIGLVGPNGAGKTTLLEIITGSISPDKGKVSVPSNSVIGYLPQQFEIHNNEISLLEETLTVFKDIKQLQNEHDFLLNEMSKFSDDKDTEYKYGFWI
jgi:ATP-binding cassette subfamily F protein 3